MHRASCLCGVVRIVVTGDLRAPEACHCSQCRRQSGHVWASTALRRTDVTVEGADRITWYQASEKARRGFCSTCGSFLFWDPVDGDTIEVGMGAFDKPTQTRLARHIFTGDRGDYYEIGDGLQQIR